jgi:Na+-driven multidrug efflux pump
MNNIQIFDDNAQLSSFRAIFGVAVPAAVLNAAQPITVVVQASLLGRYAGTNALGAFGAVSITVQFGVRVFNFLVDGVSAKTGKSVGLHAWSELTGRIRMSLGFACVAGWVASCIVATVKNPVSEHVMELTPEVRVWSMRQIFRCIDFQLNTPTKL